MQPITPEARRFLQERMPQFIRAVKQARAQLRLGKRPTSIRISLVELNEDALLVFAALWYAGSHGIAVRVLPTKEEATPDQQ
jgi:hypothetical protein